MGCLRLAIVQPSALIEAWQSGDDGRLASFAVLIAAGRRDQVWRRKSPAGVGVMPQPRGDGAPFGGLAWVRDGSANALDGQFEGEAWPRAQPRNALGLRLD